MDRQSFAGLGSSIEPRNGLDSPTGSARSPVRVRGIKWRCISGPEQRPGLLQPYHPRLAMQGQWMGSLPPTYIERAMISFKCCSKCEVRNNSSKPIAVLGCTRHKSLWYTRCCTQTYGLPSPPPPVSLILPPFSLIAPSLSPVPPPRFPAFSLWFMMYREVCRIWVHPSPAIDRFGLPCCWAQQLPYAALWVPQLQPDNWWHISSTHLLVDGVNPTRRVGVPVLCPFQYDQPFGHGTAVAPRAARRLPLAGHWECAPGMGTCVHGSGGAASGPSWVGNGPALSRCADMSLGYGCGQAFASLCEVM